ncbi:MAG: glycerate kinase family protein [Janthinobacterium lividum]
MKIILAPDSFKGSMTALNAAEAMEEGILRVYPQAEMILLPLADGGEGTLETLVAATSGRLMTANVSGPLGELLDANWGLLGPDHQTAVVEMASAAGLPLVLPEQRDPGRATTYGVGELMLEAVRAGARHIIVGLGGSATNDGGAGALQALGVRFLDASGLPLMEKLGGRELARLARIDVSGLRFPVGEVAVTIASDVTNPLLGTHGASAVYGPQKGASAEDVVELDAALANYAAVIKRDLGKDVAHLPGSGAAGGLGAGLMAVLNAQMQSGIDLVLDASGFDDKLIGADWVFTGEGRIDTQTLHGKAISGVLRRCALQAVPVIAFGGSVDDAAADALASAGLRAAFPIVSGPMTLSEAMQDGKRLMAQAAARVMRLL